MKQPTDDRILLKPLREDNATSFYNLYKDPGVNHGKEPFLPGESPLDFTKRIIGACVGIYSIRLKTDEENIIGDCALHDPRYSDSEIEIGGSLLPTFQGKGYMQEAFRLLEIKAKQIHAMQSVIARTSESNEGAIHLMKKMGYSRRSEEKNIITFCKLLHNKPLKPMEQSEDIIQWSDFTKVEMRVGTIINAEIFQEAKKPAYKLRVDFGDYGIKRSSAQITKLYRAEELIGKQVIAVINFPSKQIATLQSECLIIGAVDADDVTLLSTDKPVKNGLRIG